MLYNTERSLKDFLSPFLQYVRGAIRLVLIAIACAWQVRVLAVNVSRISLLLVVNLRFTPRSSKGSVHKLLSTKSRQKDFG